MAGESAQREYERRRDARKKRLAAHWPVIVLLSFAALLAGAVAPAFLGRIGGAEGGLFDSPAWWLGAMLAAVVALRLLSPPQSEVAWHRGAEGERAVAAALEPLAREGGRVLHDRRMPRSRANIDHLAVTRAGVYTVDAKRYRGKLRVRRGTELWIDGRNRSKLLDQARRQAEAVRSALHRAGFEDAPVHPALCFVGTELPLLFAPTAIDGVMITTPRKLASRLSGPGARGLSPVQVEAISRHLDSALPAAGTPSAPGASGRPRPAPPASSSPEGTPPTGARPEAPAPICRCGEPMVRRTRRADKMPFYGCSTFPRCRHTREIEA